MCIRDRFNDIVNLAAQICQAPISLITLIDASVQWHKARFGLEVKNIEREISFCGHAINQPDEIFIVPDATKDERFADNPLVMDYPNITFYAGIPLVTQKGLPLGALCVIDNKPRHLEDYQIKALQTLSRQVIRLFELLKLVKDLDAKETAVERQLQNMGVVCHDMKSHLRKMELSAEVLKRKHEGELDKESLRLLNDIQQEASEAIEIVNRQSNKMN